MVTTHNLGFPRIGARRELKFALEDHWKGGLSADELQQGHRGRGAQTGDHAARDVEIRNRVLGDVAESGFRKGLRSGMNRQSPSTRAPP